ncbi:hypothetical protein C4587_02830 [Candidatus Parcubacteria bacterium]|nr:MAG: hypothetical protein C4587_02830 [Candidatus Parcubacteria bacterium]
MKKAVIVLGIVIAVLLLVLFFVPGPASREVRAPEGPETEEPAFDTNDYLDEALEELDAVE